MPHIAALFRPRPLICTEAVTDEPEPHLGLIHNPSPRPYLHDEDNNMGDEAFVRVAEDPEFYLLLDR